jgi:pimeloyl-ACP methyl ester carboxylesterase
MIHGLLGSIDFFSPQLHMPGTAVHTPDMVGYGKRANAGATIDIETQAAEMARYIQERIGHPVWLLGHSVGGAVAMLVADLVPGLVRGLISVEGNFTLADAFWCTRIAATDEQVWADEFRVMRADPQAWLERGGIAPTAERLEWAQAILDNQPHDTIQSMARSVVSTTGAPAYLELVRRVIERGTPLYLLAGEKSAAGWDVPDWARVAASEYLVQPDAGHMLMLENPTVFCKTISSVMHNAAM